LDDPERRIQGVSKVFKYPLLSQERVLKLRTSNWAGTFTGPQKPIKNFGENGAWAYAWTAQSFRVPSIISGKGKATDFKFGLYIHRVHPYKILLNILGKMEHMGISKDCPKCLSILYYLRNG